MELKDVVINPDKVGFHWIKCSDEGAEPEPAKWYPEDEIFSLCGDTGYVDDVCFKEHWTYIGVCEYKGEEK